MIDYDEGWDSRWDDMKKFGPSSRHSRRIVCDLLSSIQFRSILDIGCGQGALLAEIVGAHPEAAAHGIDISESAVRLAQRYFPNGKFAILDIERSSMDLQCDLVTCTDVLEHIEDDVGALRNIARMTGRFLLASSLQGRMRDFEPEQVGHVRNYERGELGRKVVAAGFTIRETLEWGFPFYSPLYRDLLNSMGGKGTTGEFGASRKLISTLIYALFCLNSHRKGDAVFVLAEKR